jgi:hypothetical protein
MAFVNSDMMNRIENNLCISMEESLLTQPFFMIPNEQMEKMYDSIIFRYFEVYHSINFIPDETKVTLALRPRGKNEYRNEA